MLRQSFAECFLDAEKRKSDLLAHDVLGRKMNSKYDLDRGLTGYGDPDFASYLRRSFAKSMGYSSAMLRRPIIGIATAASGFNNCHRFDATACRSSETRGYRRRRIADGISNHFSGRSFPPSDEHDVPKFDVDGRGRDDSGATNERRRIDRWMR